MTLLLKGDRAGRYLGGSWAMTAGKAAQCPAARHLQPCGGVGSRAAIPPPATAEHTRAHLPWVHFRKKHNYTQQILENMHWYSCTGPKKATACCFSKESFSSLRQFPKIACFFPSPTPSCPPPLNLKHNKTVDDFHLSSPALLMTTKHWLRWLIHVVILASVCANKKML